MRPALGHSVAAAICIYCTLVPVAAAGGGPPPAIAQYTEVIPTASGQSAKPKPSTKNSIPAAVAGDLREHGGSDQSALERIIDDGSPPATQAKHAARPSKKTHVRLSKAAVRSKTRIRAMPQTDLRRAVSSTSAAGAVAASIGSGTWMLVVPLGLLALAAAYGAGRRRGTSVR